MSSVLSARWCTPRERGWAWRMANLLKKVFLLQRGNCAAEKPCYLPPHKRGQAARPENSTIMPESTSDIAASTPLAGSAPRRRLGAWLAIGSAVALIVFVCWVVLAAFAG